MSDLLKDILYLATELYTRERKGVGPEKTNPGKKKVVWSWLYQLCHF